MFDTIRQHLYTASILAHVFHTFFVKHTSKMDDGSGFASKQNRVTERKDDGIVYVVALLVSIALIILQAL